MKTSLKMTGRQKREQLRQIAEVDGIGIPKPSQTKKAAESDITMVCMPKTMQKRRRQRCVCGPNLDLFSTD